MLLCILFCNKTNDLVSIMDTINFFSCTGPWSSRLGRFLSSLPLPTHLYCAGEFVFSWVFFFLHYNNHDLNTELFTCCLFCPKLNLTHTCSSTNKLRWLITTSNVTTAPWHNCYFRKLLNTCCIWLYLYYIGFWKKVLMSQFQMHSNGEEKWWKPNSWMFCVYVLK